LWYYWSKMCTGCLSKWLCSRFYMHQ
jgi:hypothetical protein